MAGVVASGVAAALIPDTNARTIADTMMEFAPQSAKALLEATLELVDKSR